MNIILITVIIIAVIKIMHIIRSECRKMKLERERKIINEKLYAEMKGFRVVAKLPFNIN